MHSFDIELSRTERESCDTVSECLVHEHRYSTSRLPRQAALESRYA